MKKGYANDFDIGENSSMQVIYLSPEKKEKMTEKEIEKFYEPKIQNSPESLVPLYIYLILKEKTNFENRLSIAQLKDDLNERYEIDINPNTVYRTVYTLADSRVDIHYEERKGCWYSTDSYSC